MQPPLNTQQLNYSFNFHDTKTIDRLSANILQYVSGNFCQLAIFFFFFHCNILYAFISNVVELYVYNGFRLIKKDKTSSADGVALI